jgi:hypothetical protein
MPIYDTQPSRKFDAPPSVLVLSPQSKEKKNDWKIGYANMNLLKMHQLPNLLQFRKQKLSCNV